MRRKSIVESLENRKLLAAIYVDVNAPSGTNNGSSWTNAYKTLQQALSAANSGDDIRVANGTYKPTSGSDQSAIYTMKSGVDLFGGYAGYGAANPNARDTSSYLTTLSGDIGVANVSSDNVYHILYASELANPITIEGFKFTRGGADQSAGGAMVIGGAQVTLRDIRFIDNSASASTTIQIVGAEALKTVTFDDCTFKNAGGKDIEIALAANVNVRVNDSTFDGSAGADQAIDGIANFDLVIDGSSFTGYSGGNSTANISGRSTLKNSSFTNNEQTPLDIGNGTVLNCTFTSNTSTTSGGAVNVHGGAGIVTIAHSSFIENSSSANGGAIHADEHAPAEVFACTFTRNNALRGGAISNDSGDMLMSVNQSIFNGNRATSDGGAISMNTVVQVLNSTFVGNQADSQGGAVANAASVIVEDSSSLINCTFTRNFADEGGAVHNFDAQTSVLAIANSIFWNNDADVSDNIYNGAGSITVEHCDVQGGYAGSTNSNVNPKFVSNPSSGSDIVWGTDDDNYGNLKLQNDSPVIGEGDSSAISPLATNDLADGLRISGSAVDLGAYENQSTPFALRTSGLLTVNGTIGSETITLSEDDEWLTATRSGKSLRFFGEAVSSIKVFAGAGNDNVSAGSGVGGAFIAGEDGDDTIHAGAGNDTISGGAQKDQLYGGAGIDRIGGNGGNDKLYGEADDDRLYGDDGNDYLSGGLRVDRLYGGLGSDTIDGGKSNDKLYGQDGDDRLEGDEGNDLIGGGSGTDTAVEDDEDSLVTSIEILI